MSNRKNKPIPFGLENKRDMKLLDYAENQDVPFASYVKNLIEKDMVEHKSKIDKIELKNMIKEVLKEMNINSIDLDDISIKENEEEIKVSDTQKSSIKGILKNLNKTK